jgi:hypothetical protein
VQRPLEVPHDPILALIKSGNVYRALDELGNKVRKLLLYTAPFPHETRSLPKIGLGQRLLCGRRFHLIGNGVVS